MHLRVSTVHRGSKTYRYAQLVESYRRESDGKPTSRVIASLGTLDDVTIENLRRALQASREGAALVLVAERDKAASGMEVLQNLRYLDLAVLLRLWEQLGLQEILRDVLPDSEVTVDAEKILAALVLHRSVDPGSKLAAERWFPTTALPELLKVLPAQFNNSRIHRTLEALEAAEAALQERLPREVEDHDPGVAHLFIDATDTWFVGHGPPLAAKGVDKEGVYRRRVGIVLLCDQRGYPLRWKTLGGHFHDGHSLLEMASEAAKLPWLKGRPVVLDRAVGNAAAFGQLASSPLVFLTGLPDPELVSSGAPIPWDGLARLQQVSATDTPESIETAAQDAGFTRIRADRYVIDLGVFERARASRSRPPAARVAMQLADFIHEHRGLPRSGIAEALGRVEGSISRDKLLCSLLPDLQRRVREGEADGLDVSTLRKVARLAREMQLDAFEQAVLHHPASHPIRARQKSIQQALPAVHARGVLCFNPVLFARELAGEAAARRQLQLRAARINRQLASKRSHRKNDAVLGDIGAFIRKMKLGDVVSARLETHPGSRVLTLDQNEDAWARRRRCYGVMVLVGNPEIPGTPAELVDLYFSKDSIEKDFQTIKSVIELRPVHHRTDTKLRAHVTLCMLALLLQRALKTRLATTGSTHSATAAIEILKTTHLNRVRSRGRTFYTLTAPSEVQAAMIEAIGMKDLLRDDIIRKAIIPR